MKMILKKIVKTKGALKLLSWCIAKYLSLVFKTTRWQFLNEDIPQRYWQTNTPFIGSFWHGRLAMMTFAWRSSNPFYMLISHHLDGQVISQTIGYHGIKTIGGSSSQGGAQALRAAVKVLKEGATIGITPDGPRGPLFHIHEGILHIARLSGCDILPSSYSTTNRYVLNSWDRLILPLPFGKGVIIWGKPIFASQLKDTQSLTKSRHQLRHHLLEISRQADALCGHTPLERPFSPPFKETKR